MTSYDESLDPPCDAPDVCLDCGDTVSEGSAMESCRCEDCREGDALIVRIVDGADPRTVALIRRLPALAAAPVPSVLATLALGVALGFCAVYADRCDEQRDAWIAAVESDRGLEVAA